MKAEHLCIWLGTWYIPKIHALVLCAELHNSSAFLIEILPNHPRTTNQHCGGEPIEKCYRLNPQNSYTEIFSQYLRRSPSMETSSLKRWLNPNEAIKVSPIKKGLVALYNVRWTSQAGRPCQDTAIRRVTQGRRKRLQRKRTLPAFDLGLAACNHEKTHLSFINHLDCGTFLQ